MMAALVAVQPDKAAGRVEQAQEKEPSEVQMLLEYTKNTDKACKNAGKA